MYSDRGDIDRMLQEKRYHHMLYANAPVSQCSWRIISAHDAKKRAKAKAARKARRKQRKT